MEACPPPMPPVQLDGELKTGHQVLIKRGGRLADDPRGPSPPAGAHSVLADSLCPLCPLLPSTLCICHLSVTKTHVALHREQPHGHLYEPIAYPERFSLTTASARGRTHAERRASHPHKDLAKQGPPTHSTGEQSKASVGAARTRDSVACPPSTTGKERTLLTPAWQVRI